MSVAIPKRQLFIGGRWVEPVKGGRLPVINPSTEEEIGTIPAATPADVDAAVSAAQACVDSGEWTRSTGAYRAKILHAIADKVREQKTFLATLESLDNGKPLAEAEWDVDDVATCFDYYADLAAALDARQYEPVDLGAEGFECALRRDPLGVVALITPWNYPLLMSTWKVAPALAAGNAAVLKPSEAASLTSLELAGIAAGAGLPPGALNVVTGLGPDAGAPLSADPRVAKVAFTGSTGTGRAVYLAAARNLRPAVMELGGKSALIVFDDADVARAVEWAMFGVFWTNGQICSSTSRLLVQRGIAPAFYKQLKRRTESIKISDPLVPGCRLGPLVNELQYKKVVGYVEAGKADGATLLTGGRRPPHMPKGYYLEPTVFIDCKPEHRIWREEIFGPVLASATFETEAEAIALANGSEFGLAAGVISSDLERCRAGAGGAAGRHLLDQLQPALLLPGALGRGQELRLRPRAGALWLRGLHVREAGDHLHQLGQVGLVPRDRPLPQVVIRD
ncbi:ALDH10 [Auxenochlorella protothecoides x Auxenochlorella symbiontica]